MPRVVGDNEFCVGEATTVRDAKQQMHLVFWLVLLESVLEYLSNLLKMFGLRWDKLCIANFSPSNGADQKKKKSSSEI